MQNHWLFSSNNIYFCKCQKADEKKSKEDEKTLEELNSAHRRSQAKCQLIQTSYIKQIKLFLFSPYNKHLINRAKSVCMGESVYLSRVYRPHCVLSVLTTSVKILPYRPPAWLIRANYSTKFSCYLFPYYIPDDNTDCHPFYEAERLICQIVTHI